jgi:hypothetical protein
MKTHHAAIIASFGLTLGLWGQTAAAGPVAFPGFAPPATLPADWVGGAAAPSLLNLKPARSTLGANDLRRFGANGSATTPLCISQSGWIGGAYVYRAAGQPDRAFCVVNDGTGQLGVSPPALLLEPREGISVSWLGWSSTLVEPRGAAVVFEQPNGRMLRACSVNVGTGPSAETVFGYVGDDGRCYGVELDGFTGAGTNVQAQGARKGYDNYMLLMRGTMTGDAVLPQDGWLQVRGGLLPRGVLHRLRTPQVSGMSAVACRGKQGNDTWPGLVNETTMRCNLFTYYGGKTGRAQVADFEVVRYAQCLVGNAPSQIEGSLGTTDGLCSYNTARGRQTTASFSFYRGRTTAVSNTGPITTVAGTGYYLCSASKHNDSKNILGFTNMVFPHTAQINGCTDGSLDVRAAPDNQGDAKVWIMRTPTDDRG